MLMMSIGQRPFASMHETCHLPSFSGGTGDGRQNRRSTAEKLANLVTSGLASNNWEMTEEAAAPIE